MNDDDVGEPNRILITGSVVLATLMVSLDSTIANVALPHIQGSVQASADQVTWVLTSYIVATAIVTPMTGWLAGRMGRKWLFVFAISGFTLASALCGAAQSLGQIVGFRVLQGVFGATIVPLSQAVLLDIYPPREQAGAMSVWAMGSLIGPIAGPALGGFLTDNLSWRWVFYVNLPFGAIACLGALMFIHRRGHAEKTPFDFTGFALLSVMIAAFQLMLDRGQDQGWFGSPEIVIEAAVAGVALLMFAIQTLTAEKPFVPRGLLADGSFVTGTVFSFLVMILLFSTMALLPQMLETLLGYPVVTTGLITAPRGVGSFLSMSMVGWLMRFVPPRTLMGIGIALSAAAIYGMSQFSLAMDSSLVMWTGFVQGIGLGLVWIPMTTVSFATLKPIYRADGAGFSSLVRSMGSSIGISIMQVVHSRDAALSRSHMIERLRLDNPVTAPLLRAPYSLTSPTGAAVLNGELARQSAMVGYVNAFNLMFLLALIMLPMLLLIRPAPSHAVAGLGAAVE